MAGLALVVGSALGIDRTRHFPGLWALLPVAGTVLLITSGPEAWLNRAVLAHRVMVGIGLISYPLYLWHWPVLVFAGILSPVPLSAFTTAGLLVFVLVISWLSYRFVEKPLRNKKGIIQTRKAAFALGFAI